MNDERHDEKPRYQSQPRVHYHPAKTLGISSTSIPSIPADAARIISALLDIIEEAAPLPQGRHKDLRRDVLELWRELTSEKSTRQADYIGEPARLAAYLRYFLPWNVVRMVPLLAGLDLGLKAGDGVLDIGSGPLTVPIALWIARPELRGVELRIDCIDRVRRVMELGATILEGIALRTGQPFSWKVGVRKDSFSIVSDETEHERYALVTAANVFNESFWKLKGSLAERADLLASSLGAFTSPQGRIFIVEPGDPRSGAMMASLREAVILRGGRPLAPCPHSSACPMAGAFLSSAFRKDEDGEYVAAGHRINGVVTARGRSKAPWCHFVIDPGAAPDRLSVFSESAGLPKDRLVASWLLLQPEPPSGSTASPPSDRTVRIVSDAFRLPDGGSGRYACTATGYTLARDSLADLPSGSLAVLSSPLPSASGERDPKSSAVIVRAHSDSIAPVPVAYKPPRPDRKRGGPPDRHGKREADSRRAPKALAERSPYARAKKPWGPYRPKRST